MSISCIAVGGMYERRIQNAQTGTVEDVAKYSKRTVRVTKEHNDDCKRLLKLMGVPIIEARSPHSFWSVKRS